MCAGARSRANDTASTHLPLLFIIIFLYLFFVTLSALFALNYTRFHFSLVAAAGVVFSFFIPVARDSPLFFSAAAAATRGCPSSLFSNLFPHQLTISQSACGLKSCRLYTTIAIARESFRGRSLARALCAATSIIVKWAKKKKK